MSAVVKTCSCGKRYTQKELDAFPPEETPTQRQEWGTVLKYFNCKCGSTFAIVVRHGMFKEQMDYDGTYDPNI